MAWLALGAPCRAAGDRPRMASAWRSSVLDLKSRHRMGRPAVSPDVRALIREMSTANPMWGAPRIHGELLKLGISVSESTVAKYMRRHPRPPSQPWRTFLTNHASQIMAADLFVVPTVTFPAALCSRHPRPRPATDRPRGGHRASDSGRTAQQLRNAFPENEAPRYLLHDRDSVFAHARPPSPG